MPLYEYECQECGNRFETLRPVDGDDAEVRCPACGAGGVERKLSTFASPGEPHASSGCGHGGHFT